MSDTTCEQVLVPVRLKIGGLLEHWAAKVIAYSNPVLEISGDYVFIYADDGLNAIRVPIPDNEYMDTEFNRAWNMALGYVNQRTGIDYSEYKRPFKVIE